MLLSANMLLILDLIVGFMIDMKILRIYKGRWTTAWLLSGAPLSLDWTGAAGSASVGLIEYIVLTDSHQFLVLSYVRILHYFVIILLQIITL